MLSQTVVVLSDRPAVVALVEKAVRTSSAWTLRHWELSQPPVYPELGTAAALQVVVLDIVPDPSHAAEHCLALRRIRDDVPIVAMVCCPQSCTSVRMRFLSSAGIRSVVDLHTSPAELWSYLIASARGDRIVRLQLSPPAADGYDFAPAAGGPGAGAGAVTRHMALIKLVAAGLSDKDIGHHLNLSPHTVHHRIEHLCREVGARNRTQLAGWAGSQGLYGRDA